MNGERGEQETERERESGREGIVEANLGPIFFGAIIKQKQGNEVEGSSPLIPFEDETWRHRLLWLDGPVIGRVINTSPAETHPRARDAFAALCGAFQTAIFIPSGSAVTTQKKR